LLILAGVGCGIYLLVSGMNSSEQERAKASCEVIAAKSNRTGDGAGDAGQNLSQDAAKLDDEQLYGYIRAKQGQAGTPPDKVAALQSYLQRYPRGRHVGEITALLEDATKKSSDWTQQQKVGTVRAECFATLGSGQTIPVQGWIELLEEKSGDAPALYRALTSLDQDAEVKRAADLADKVDDRSLYVVAVGEYLRKTFSGLHCVSRIDIVNGIAEFHELPAGSRYVLFGCGWAGQNFVGLCTFAKADGGKVVTVSPPPVSCLLSFAKEKRARDSSLLLAFWAPVEWTDQQAEAAFFPK